MEATISLTQGDLRAYPPETVIAEKFHAMLVLGTTVRLKVEQNQLLSVV